MMTAVGAATTTITSNDDDWCATISEEEMTEASSSNDHEGGVGVDDDSRRGRSSSSILEMVASDLETQREETKTTNSQRNAIITTTATDEEVVNIWNRTRLQTKGKLFLQGLFFAFASAAMLASCSFTLWWIITLYWTDSQGITRYGMGLGKCIILSIIGLGLALVAAMCLTYFICFLTCGCCNENMTIQRKRWFLLIPILSLLIIPGLYLQNSAQNQLEYYDTFDYYGAALVLLAGSHYHNWTSCATHTQSICDTAKGEFKVQWDTTNVTTGLCTSYVYQPLCDYDACMHDNEVKKSYRCPTSEESTINQSLTESNQCMKHRYEDDLQFSIEYLIEDVKDFAYYYDFSERPDDSYIFILGNSINCQALLPFEHDEPIYYQHIYNTGKKFVQGGIVVIGLIFIGSIVEYFFPGVCFYTTVRRRIAEHLQLEQQDEEEPSIAPLENDHLPPFT